MVQRIHQSTIEAESPERKLPPEPIASQLDEIISMQPARILRWGSLIIFLVVLILATCVSFIKYPDYLEGHATVTTNPLPLPIKIGQSGKVIHLFASDEQRLRQGQLIAELENTTGYENIIQLDRFCDNLLSTITHKDEQQLLILSSTSLDNLGEAQASFNAIKSAIEAYLRRNFGSIHERREQLLETQLNNIRSLQESKSQSVSILAQQVNDAAEQFEAYQKLYDQKVISKQELATEAKRYRDILIAAESHNQSLIQNSISAAEQQKQLMELRHSEADKKLSQASEIVAQLRNLQSFIREWKLRYLIIAPTNGRIYFKQEVQQNESFQAEQELAVIVPDKAEMIAELSMPTSGVGKVQQNQQVQIYLDQYPKAEFGYVKAAVQSVSTLPASVGNEPRYRIIARLPERLLTSYSTPIQFSGVMHGSARIVLNERSVLERLIVVLREAKN